MPRRKADLVDADLDFDADPEPTAARARRTRRTPAKTTPPRVRSRATSGRILSKAAMQTKVREEIEMYLSLAQGAWSLRDECAEAASPERIAVIADSLTAMISRSDALLEMASKSGIIGEIVKLLTVMMPIARAVWSAHGPSGSGHRPPEEVQRDWAHQYPAPTIA